MCYRGSSLVVTKTINFYKSTTLRQHTRTQTWRWPGSGTCECVWSCENRSIERWNFSEWKLSNIARFSWVQKWKSRLIRLKKCVIIFYGYYRGNFKKLSELFWPKFSWNTNGNEIKAMFRLKDLNATSDLERRAINTCTSWKPSDEDIYCW